MTIAQQLKITEFPFRIKDSKGNEIYFENSYGHWQRRELDTNGNQIYYEDSFGFWVKRGYAANGNEIYYENSHGDIEDNRPKTEVQKSAVFEKLNSLIDCGEFEEAQKMIDQCRKEMGNLPEFEASEVYMARVEILAEHEREYSTVKKDAIYSIITVLQIGL
jgi:hypothetical protein